MQAFAFFCNGWHFIGEFHATHAARGEVSYLFFTEAPTIRITRDQVVTFLMCFSLSWWKSITYTDYMISFNSFDHFKKKKKGRQSIRIDILPDSSLESVCVYRYYDFSLSVIQYQNSSSKNNSVVNFQSSLQCLPERIDIEMWKSLTGDYHIFIP